MRLTSKTHPPLRLASLVTRRRGSPDDGPELLSSECVDFSASASHLCILKRRLVTLYSRQEFSFVDAATLQDDATGVRVSSSPKALVDVEYANGGVVCWEPRPVEETEGSADGGGGAGSEETKDPDKELYLRILNR